MYNSEQNGHYAPFMSPRISFSNDFAEAQHSINQEIRSSRSSEIPTSSDFEFSVTNYSMISADELFCKGKLLPYKDTMQRTLRDELCVDDDDGEDDKASRRPPKGPTRWKGLLGLKRSHIGSKKVDRSTTDLASETVAEGRRRSGLINED